MSELSKDLESLFVPASLEERRSTRRKKSIARSRRLILQEFLRSRAVTVSIGFLLLLALLAIIVPALSPYSYDRQIRGAELIAPFHSLSHPLGTDALGRDEMVRLLFGTRISLAIGVTVSLLSVAIGVVYGAVSGYFGGWADSLMMRAVEIISSIPALLVIILLYVAISEPLKSFLSHHPSLFFLQNIGPALISIFITFALLFWTDTARIVRGQILKLKESDFILAARACGASHSRIIFRHLIPNSLGVILITATLNIPSAIFGEAYLSFLGLGVSPPMCSLGSLANDALAGVYTYPHLLILPSALICLIILAFHRIGDGLRDTLDPTSGSEV
ncbi:MAG TPA: ABC transporter permease [Clostridia bacterium]|nr:ABC transporter permease [Clostridia bacterium]